MLFEICFFEAIRAGMTFTERAAMGSKNLVALTGFEPVFPP